MRHARMSVGRTREAVAKAVALVVVVVVVFLAAMAAVALDENVKRSSANAMAATFMDCILFVLSLAAVNIGWHFSLVTYTSIISKL